MDRCKVPPIACFCDAALPNAALTCPAGAVCTPSVMLGGRQPPRPVESGPIPNHWRCLKRRGSPPPKNSSQASAEMAKSQSPLNSRFAGVSGFCSCPGSQVSLTGRDHSQLTRFSPGEGRPDCSCSAFKWNTCIYVGRGVELGRLRAPPSHPLP